MKRRAGAFLRDFLLILTIGFDIQVAKVAANSTDDVAQLLKNYIGSH